MIWLTGDNHFGHRNILEYCNRPFNDVDEMDAAMINNWNRVVGANDTVIHLGDFCFGNYQAAQSMWTQLNGNIRMMLYPWHHDYKWLKEWHGGSGTRTGYVHGEPSVVHLRLDGKGDMPLRKANGKIINVVLCHFPLESWGELLHLHAHSHGKRFQVGLKADVGVDNRKFTPTPLETEVDLLLKSRNSVYTPIRGGNNRNKRRKRR